MTDDLTRRIQDLESHVQHMRAQIESKPSNLVGVSGATGDSTSSPFGSISMTLKKILNWGFVWVGTKVNVKPKAIGGITVDQTGVSAKLKTAGGLLVDTNGLYVNWALSPGYDLPSRVSVQFDKTTDTTLASITGLSASLGAGKKYRFTVRLFVDADATGGHKYAMAAASGLTATTIVYQVNSIDNAGNAFIINSRQTSLGGSVGEASTSVYYTEINGFIVVGSAGLLVPQFAQNAANLTSSVLVGSHMIVQEIVL